MQNFAFPYFSRNIAEFWRSWHISLTTWFRDYLYIPIGGSRGNILFRVRNVVIIFLVSGLWHGANWTFVLWGLLNAIYIIPSIILRGSSKEAKENINDTFKKFLLIGITFTQTIFAWIFFRAENVNSAFIYIHKILSFSLISIPDFRPKHLIFLILFLLIIEWFGRNGKHALANIFEKQIFIFRWAVYLFILISIFSYGGQEKKFIYFQF